MIDVKELRPSGIKRKLLQSPVFDTSSAADFIIGYFPHGGIIRGIYLITTTALTAANANIDIGVAQNGDTIVDGYAIVQSTSAIGDILNITDQLGTNGLQANKVMPVGTTLWFQTDGGGDAGAVMVVIEYEDNNN